MVKLNVIGLNCGTSVDGEYHPTHLSCSDWCDPLLTSLPGVDVAHVLIESIGSSPHVSIELLSYREHPVPSHLRKRVLELCRRGASTTLEEICDLNFELGGLFADAVLASGIDLAEVDLVACHGQTLWHSPVALHLGDGYAKGERRMSTLQMAESAVINEKTGM
jgi:anhydro-N-acetylmuramic acid kinase